MKPIKVPSITGALIKKFFQVCFKAEYRYWSIFTCVSIILILSLFLMPSRGNILPVGKEVRQAYQLLLSTNAGKHLIENVQRVTAGSFIYLTLGTTEWDNLRDENGDKVRGLTRVGFKLSGISCYSRQVTVITNRDVVGCDPREIVKSLAFELENVYQAYNLKYVCAPKDSPRAPLTQARVIEELCVCD